MFEKTTTTIIVDIDPELKQEADAVLHKLGLTTSQAITIFLQQVILDQGIPFDVVLLTNGTPNAETLAAIHDSIHHRNTNMFSSLNEALKDLGI